MHVAPSVRVVVRRFGQWRVVAWLLMLCSCAALCAWLVSAPQELRFGWALVVMPGVALAFLSGIHGLRCRPFALRWDRQAWHLEAPDATAGEPAPGAIDVSLDFGRWMLLRFRRDGAVRGAAFWLPVQRAGLEPQWHALRCALYSPQPRSLSPAGFGGRPGP